MNFDNYKFRPSQVGILMTNGRDKTQALGETVKNYLDEIYIEAKYGKRKDIKSKFLEKGLMVEEDSITLYTDFKNELFFKNEKRFENDFLIGTPDIVTRNEIIDIKSSWDIYSFRKAQREDNKIYYWQLQSYMELTGRKNATLVYCLVDTPEPLVQREIKQVFYQSGLSDDNEAFHECTREIIQYYSNSSIPIEERVYEKHYEFDPEKMEELHQRILECREYLNRIK